MFSKMLLLTMVFIFTSINICHSFFLNKHYLLNNTYLDDIQHFCNDKKDMKTYYYKKILFQTQWIYKKSKYSFVVFKNNTDLSDFKLTVVNPIEYPEFSTIYALLM